jgi:phosphoribosyl-ATP pyrophosphohydrolase/phosphoribosyl-AMP cyclohydrolase
MRDRNAALSESDISSLAWDKMDGLLPAAVQDCRSGRLLMLGYMNREALEATLETGLATFWSRSKQRLWQKGETSGNTLRVAAVHKDCDSDALLILAEPRGPACHLGTTSCFGGEGPDGPGEGLPRIAQKVGEEGVEVALAAVTRDAAGCAEEVADLLYHLIVLMQAKGLGWEKVIEVLRQRHKA